MSWQRLSLRPWLRASSSVACPASLGDSNLSPVASASSADGRLFHSLTLLQAGWAVVFGGRRSPVRPALEVCCLRVLESASASASGTLRVELTRLLPVEELPLPRWRHTATTVVHQGGWEALSGLQPGRPEAVWAGE